MTHVEQIDALLKEWNDATALLDIKYPSCDASLLFPSSMFTTKARHLTHKAPTTVVKNKEMKTIQQESGEMRQLENERPMFEKSCRPWNREDFLARVGTFSIGTWFAKPAVISVFACARNGWINTKQDQLYCPCCEQYLCFTINSKLSHAGVLVVANEFAKLLVTGHAGLCPWRENPSPEAFTTLPIATRRQVLETFTQRMKEAVALIASHETLGEAVRKLQLDKQFVERVCREAEDNGADHGNDAIPRPDVHTFTTKLSKQVQSASDGGVGKIDDKMVINVALLSVCGWEFQKDSKEEVIVHCGSCNRRWSLSHVAATSTRTTTSSKSDNDRKENECGGALLDRSEPAPKRQKVVPTQPKSVDLIAEHRWFCPWVAPSQTRVGAKHQMENEIQSYGCNDAALWEFMQLPGWQQYSQALRLMEPEPAEKAYGGMNNHQHLQHCITTPEEALESIRAVIGLKDW